MIGIPYFVHVELGCHIPNKNTTSQYLILVSSSTLRTRVSVSLPCPERIHFKRVILCLGWPAFTVAISLLLPHSPPTSGIRPPADFTRSLITLTLLGTLGPPAAPTTFLDLYGSPASMHSPRSLGICSSKRSLGLYNSGSTTRKMLLLEASKGKISEPIRSALPSI